MKMEILNEKTGKVQLTFDNGAQYGGTMRASTQEEIGLAEKPIVAADNGKSGILGILKQEVAMKSTGASIRLAENRYAKYLRMANDEADKSKHLASPITDADRESRHQYVKRQTAQFIRADHPQLHISEVERIVDGALKSSSKEFKRSLFGVSNATVENYRENRAANPSPSAEGALRATMLDDPAATIAELKGECSRYERVGDIAASEELTPELDLNQQLNTVIEAYQAAHEGVSYFEAWKQVAKKNPEFSKIMATKAARFNR